ncbi:ATP synthase f chain, mitochondrial precursor [Orbilia oligospora]|uniref:ATP synthase f chain, mitochondrial n=3 Tax=Orbiliaceae TaxID=47021 RepID=G1WZ33_ARTOA|nr:hypothetical protein AOL_s00004g544 [Orbilia oligospora ATCC 24927]KAF3080522.1 ATP synthase f chain, mitochondrial precursor [Orbilia oligospora]EGX53885.1 hypothetical protein AOL_s00004g544 [Orbilia oligospora ATCC 24927]KAF3082620.1 ATP synthase f chain, mitochondrial precursor [Orbilia oligospora]KAF3097704.1 ATP synthase f chain, mitochondrial precursor [Orbilia oligospora]KAF3130076.1 ATP synthase f chain, mitochondrial precursor [Orbilia oligospora]
MSLIFRRGISTIIPPKVANPNAIGQAQNAVRMARLVELYTKLPKGPAPKIQGKGLIGRYKAKYFDGENASAAPLLHIFVGLIAFGYAQNYYYHLRHHKNNAH